MASLLFFFKHESLGCRNKQLNRCAFISVGGWQHILLTYSKLNCFLLSSVFAVRSQGAEIVNALALFLLLLLDLFMIGRQERLKCKEVERRLQMIIDKINGEASFICLSFGFVFPPHWIFLQNLIMYY